MTSIIILKSQSLIQLFRRYSTKSLSGRSFCRLLPPPVQKELSMAEIANFCSLSKCDYALSKHYRPLHFPDFSNLSLLLYTIFMGWPITLYSSSFVYRLFCYDFFRGIQLPEMKGLKFLQYCAYFVYF